MKMNLIFLYLDTAVSEIEDCFKRFIKRDDIDIILINQNFAELIRHVIDSHVAPVPAVLEIPSKDHPYDASKDSILRRAKVRKSIKKCLAQECE
jgi:V-type H+-transporting ATPase subunit F